MDAAQRQRKHASLYTGRVRVIYFETHATSLDNEAGLASGHYDTDLSPLGEKQAGGLGKRYAAIALDRVLCSDLRRSWRTADIAFADRAISIVRDPRLRECAYGEWDRAPQGTIDTERPHRINVPFPGGQSYLEVVGATRACLDDHSEAARVLIVGHRATWYALEHLLRGRELAEVIATPWRWQPGWQYAR